MAHFFGMTRLGSPEQWRGLAGEGKWREGRSAYELAYAWQGANGIPPGIRSILNESGVPHLKGLKLEVGLVEKPSFLDTPMAPSMTDIMGYARNGSGDPLVIAVEGKATESFGLPIRAWVRGDLAVPPADAQPRVSRKRRLDYLAKRLGIPADAESPLHYQLLHRTVAALNEATLYGAACSLLLVHSFAPADEPTWRAYAAFLTALGDDNARKNVLSKEFSPPAAGESPLYALWYQDAPRPPA